ncbi:MAG: hypothetical protein AAGD25_06550 [Cyanobacteria bacterium P01_F01_bin.150]
MNYLVYDCEIIKCIPQKGVDNDPNYDYCDGWHDHANMGIACIGWAHSNGSQGVIVIDCDDPRQEMIEMAIDTLYHGSHSLVGFNSKAFDDKLIYANRIYQTIHPGFDRQAITTDYDLLELIRIAAYGSPKWQDCPKGYSYALGRIGEANGFPKTGSGELAPKLWQDGKRQEVIDYCLNDVKITRALFDLGLQGQLVDPNTGSKLDISGLVDES